MNARGRAPGYVLARDGSALFLAEFPGASRVRLAGDFTLWGDSPRTLSRGADGLWEARVAGLAPGLHGYKYVVDDTWQCDPAHDARRPDGFGGQNSTLVVGDAGRSLGGMHALRVASLNLHTWQEPDALGKLARVADVCAALDVHALALQEVGQHLDARERGRFPNAGEVLRAALTARTGVRYEHAWFPAHTGFGCFDEGLSLLARVPLEGARCHELGGQTWRRIAVSARLRAARPLRLVSAHTSWPADGGDAEVAALLAALAHDDAPGVLVAGDFNAGPREAQVARMCAAGFADVGGERGVRAPTFFADAARLDYQFLRARDDAWRAVGFAALFDGASVAGVAQPRVSDHAGLLGVYAPAIHP